LERVYGASLAWWLARAGESVTIVDQFGPGDVRASSGGGNLPFPSPAHRNSVNRLWRSSSSSERMWPRRCNPEPPIRRKRRACDVVPTISTSRSSQFTADQLLRGQHGTADRSSPSHAPCGGPAGFEERSGRLGCFAAPGPEGGPSVSGPKAPHPSSSVETNLKSSVVPSQAATQGDIDPQPEEGLR
jgi:hypothetical protein